MSDTIESKVVGAVDGFDITARIVRIVPDTGATPFEADCYGPEDVQAWRDDEWSFVGTIVTASRAGVEFGESSIWASEYGTSPGWQDRFISPLDGEGEAFINGYGPELIAEAISAAKAKLEELRVSK